MCEGGSVEETSENSESERQVNRVYECVERQVNRCVEKRPKYSKVQQKSNKAQSSPAQHGLTYTGGSRGGRKHPGNGHT